MNNNSPGQLASYLTIRSIDSADLSDPGFHQLLISLGNLLAGTSDHVLDEVAGKEVAGPGASMTMRIPFPKWNSIAGHVMDTLRSCSSY